MTDRHEKTPDLLAANAEGTVLQARHKPAGEDPLTVAEPVHPRNDTTDDSTRAIAIDPADATVAKTRAILRPPATDAVPDRTDSLDDLIRVKEQATPLRAGTVLRDRFVLVEEVGGGAMGLVFRAKDLRKEEAGNRDPYVALKVLTPEFAGDTRMMLALLEEAKKAQSLAHPNIITVYDADREGSVVFLTMELLQGETLKEVLGRHRDGLPRDQAYDIIRGICLGLAYAHRKGIVHSDFKPGNVFHTRAGETRILDFGIARALPRGGDDDELPDAGGEERVGGFTPAYASPQMLQGLDPQPNDDVFALGIVVYQLLTGIHPFGNKPADQAEARGKVPERSKRFTKNEWRALSAALAFDPALRPADASAFLKLLEGTSPLRRWAIAAMVGFGITAAYLVYDGTQEVLETLPDVAFDALPAEQQAAFNELLQDARVADQFNDFSSALDLYVRAYQLHPRNSEAVEAIEVLVDRIRVQALDSGDPHARRSAYAHLRQVADVDDHLGTLPPIVEALAALD